MGEKRILTAGPYVDDKEAEYVLDAVRNGWNEHWNDYLVKFEKAFSEYVGMDHAMATSSCTGALHLALAALGIGEGDEVIIPDLTWIATAAAVCYIGAKPVFVDVDEISWTIDPESFQRAITPKTKAVMPVHLYGHPAEMDKVMRIAKDNNLFVIEDAAPSIGATFKGKRTGSFGDFAAFSFQGAKLLVTGEGGMLLSNSKEAFLKAKNLNDHGRDPKIPFWINRIGFKYKMSNMQAAFGLAQLEKIDMLIERKRQIFSWYKSMLSGLHGISLNREREDVGAKSIYWMTSILVDPDDAGIGREEVIRKLDKEYNIDTRPVFPKVSRFPMFEEMNNQVAGRIADTGINLPSGACLEKGDVERVCKAIIEIVG